MHAPPAINVQPTIVLPGDSEQVRELKAKVNELIRKLDEVYRLLRADVEIMDFRELPPHPTISHSRWKFYQDPDTGDLVLYHRTGGVWGPSGWSIIGDLVGR